MCRTYVFAKKKGNLIMTSSNARVIVPERKNIVMTKAVKKNDLRAQKITGTLTLAAVGTSVFIGGDASALIMLAPMALAAIFSKEKLLDFGIFPKSGH